MKTMTDVLQWTRNRANNYMIMACDALADDQGNASAFYTGKAQAFREVGGYLEWIIKDGIEAKEENKE